MGRPSTYSDETALIICERIAMGKSLKSICDDDDMPHMSTVFRWLADETLSKFRDNYARAREVQADTIFDEILDIADTQEVGQRIKTGKDGIEITEEDMLGHRRLQIDARKWIASKLAPKKYGEKIDVTSDGEKIGMPAITIPVPDAD